MAEDYVIRFLQTVPLCQGVQRRELELLAGILQPRGFSPGGVLFKEGESGDCFYLVIEGEVGVYKRIPGAGQERLTTLGPRALVGHMCLIDGQPRSASCVAHLRTQVLRGDRTLFDRLFREGDLLAFRFLEAISQDLSQALRTSNQHFYDLYARPEETTVRLKRVAQQLARRLDEDCERAEVVAPARQDRVKRSWLGWVR